MLLPLKLLLLKLLPCCCPLRCSLCCAAAATSAGFATACRQLAQQPETEHTCSSADAWVAAVAAGGGAGVVGTADGHWQLMCKRIQDAEMSRWRQKEKSRHPPSARSFFPGGLGAILPPLRSY